MMVLLHIRFEKKGKVALPADIDTVDMFSWRHESRM